MHLDNDCTRPYGDGPGARSRCRIRVYRPDDRERDAPVVIASELAGNPGAGVTDAAEFLAAEVMTAHLFDTFVWIEHRPPEATAGRQETFALVVFAHYYVPEQVVIEGTRCKRLGKPTLKRLDRATVEAIVGQKV